MSKKSSIDPIYARLIDDQPRKSRTIEQTEIKKFENDAEILIDSDNEDELTSSGVSEDEDFEEEETKEHQCHEGRTQNRLRIGKNTKILGNILQPINFNTQFVLKNNSFDTF